MKRVILETPYKGGDWESTEENLRFARLCGHDCIVRGEAYFASHLLYTQDGVLDDKIPEERTLGIEAGFAWKEIADATVIYINRGISHGMYLGVRKTIELGQVFEYRNLSGYDKAPSPKIITTSGTTGCGKTTIVGKFLEMKPDARMITSYTSRGPRDSDLLGEYEYGVSAEYFKKHKDEFLWVISAHGNTYGTTKDSVLEALSSPGPHLMILVPPVVQLLKDAVIKLAGCENKVLSFYVLSPEEKELQRRLTSREADQVIRQKRLEDAKLAKKYDELALQSEIPYIFLTNNELNVGPTKAAQQMLVFV